MKAGCHAERCCPTWASTIFGGPVEQRKKVVAAIAGGTLVLAATAATLAIVNNDSRPVAVSARQSASPTTDATLNLALPGAPTPWMTTGPDGQQTQATTVTTGLDGTPTTVPLVATPGPDGQSTPFPLLPSDPAHPGAPGPHNPVNPANPVNGPGTSGPTAPSGTPSSPTNSSTRTPTRPPGGLPRPSLTPKPTPPVDNPGGQDPGNGNPPAGTPGVPVVRIGATATAENADAFKANVDAVATGTQVAITLPADTAGTAELLDYAKGKGLVIHLVVDNADIDWVAVGAELGPRVDVWQLFTNADTLGTSMEELKAVVSVATTAVNAADPGSIVSVGISGGNLAGVAAELAPSADALTVPGSTNATEVASVSKSIGKPIFMLG